MGLETGTINPLLCTGVGTFAVPWPHVSPCPSCAGSRVEKAPGRSSTWLMQGLGEPGTKPCPHSQPSWHPAPPEQGAMPPVPMAAQGSGVSCLGRGCRATATRGPPQQVPWVSLHQDPPQQVPSVPSQQVPWQQVLPCAGAEPPLAQVSCAARPCLPSRKCQAPGTSTRRGPWPPAHHRSPR